MRTAIGWMIALEIGVLLGLVTPWDIFEWQYWVLMVPLAYVNGRLIGRLIDWVPA